MTLNAKLITQVIADYTDPLALTIPRDSLNFDKRLRLANGVGADQADLLWHSQRTVSASTDDDLDLAGSLEDAFGNTVTFTTVKGMVVFADASNGDTIAVGGEGVNPFASWVGSGTDTVLVRPGGGLALFAPDATAYAVTAGTGDILRVTNNDAGGDAIYDIILVGVSA